jgi:hypothetical protein
MLQELIIKLYLVLDFAFCMELRRRITALVTMLPAQCNVSSGRAKLAEVGVPGCGSVIYITGIIVDDGGRGSQGRSLRSKLTTACKGRRLCINLCVIADLSPGDRHNMRKSATRRTAVC